MPFTDDLPAENTDPWFTPLVAAWTALKSFVNGLETSLADKVDDGDARLTNQRVPTDGSVTDAKVAVGAAIDQSKIADLTLDLDDIRNDVSTALDGLEAKVNIADVAGLDTVGWARAVFIENGGTVPVGTPEYTIVIEAGA